jgi:hypothetical protein
MNPPGQNLQKNQLKGKNNFTQYKSIHISRVVHPSFCMSLANLLGMEATRLCRQFLMLRLAPRNPFQGGLGHNELVPDVFVRNIDFPKFNCCFLSPLLKGFLFFLVTARTMDK